jgi:methionyl-tRNA formyltransferase
MNPITFAFFGSSRFSVIVLDELAVAGFLPALVVTTPDKPQGRGLKLQPTPVKEWAIARKIPVLDPAKLDAEFAKTLEPGSWKLELFIVASYGKIIPGAIISLPKHGSLNIHPSLLPKYRGASPLQSAMLDDQKQTGVTIIRMDEKMDHGPIVAQKETPITEWPIYEEFEKLMAVEGARLLASILPGWIFDTVKAHEQDHAAATFTKKISKEDALLVYSAEKGILGDQYLAFRKIQAYHEWPGAYFFIERGGKQMRIKITAASYRDGKLMIERVIPEGKKEMAWADASK